MAYPLNIRRLSTALDIIENELWAIYASVNKLRTLAIAGDTARPLFIGLQSKITKSISSIDGVLAAVDVPSLIAFAQEQYADTNLDIATEFTSAKTAAIALRDWIYNNFPKEITTSAVLENTLTQDGDRVPLVFNAAQRAAFVAKCDTFLLTIAV